MAKIVQHLEGLHGRQSDFLAFSTLSTVAEKSAPVVWVRPSATIEEVCELIKAHRVLSLPIYDEEKRRVIGMADILDVCAYLCWGTMHFFTSESEAASLEEIAKKMKEVRILDALQAKERPPSHDVVIKRNLDSVGSLLDPMAMGLHRALVRTWPEDEDEEGQCLEHYRLVAQIDMVRFLVDHKRNLNQHLISGTVDALGMVTPSPVRAAASAPATGPPNPTRTLIYSTEEGKTALEAFRKLSLSGVHAIGVVGTGQVGGQTGGQVGHLLYNLSASDLRGITPDTAHLLREPVEIFLSRVQEEDPTRPKNLITCTPDATLMEVMELLVQAQVHRVWVVDQQHRPVGLITLTDILSKFASYDYSRAQAAVGKTIVPLSDSSSAH